MMESTAVNKLMPAQLVDTIVNEALLIFSCLFLSAYTPKGLKS